MAFCVGVSSQVDCAIKIRNLETKLDSVVCTIKDRKELEKHVPMPIETVVEYDKAASLWSLHEQIKQMEVAVEKAAQSSSRRSKWQFMGARDACGVKEELRQVYGVSERTEGDGAANLIQKLRAINYALDELGQWCAFKVQERPTIICFFGPCSVLISGGNFSLFVGYWVKYKFLVKVVTGQTGQKLADVCNVLFHFYVRETILPF